ncbi:MAG: PCMD domain-containing protein [Bacteroidales bacterium]|jgi:hypothetical protein
MKKIALFLVTVIFITGCKKDEEASDEAHILDFSVVNTSITGFSLEQVFIDEKFSHVLVLSQNNLSDENPPISFIPEIEISPGATIFPNSGDEVSFYNKDEAISYVVTAENGDQVTWSFTIRDMQLPNAGFEDWYDTVGMNGGHYLEPGLSARSTVWSTANMGTSIYGEYGTQPITDGENTLVQITTGETSSVPVTSGTIFTGKFDIQGAINNPTDPSQATDFGIPFTFRPVALKLNYKFTPGEHYVDGTLVDPNDIFGGFTIDTLEGSDQCYLWSFLEIINGDDVQVVAKAELVQGDTVKELTEVIIPYVYESDLKPTHISVVLSSSKDGGEFRGAVGSTLIVDDVELVYE